MINKIKHYFAIRKVIKRYKMLSAMINSIDRAFIKKGISRHDRRQFWNDFVNDENSRKKFIQEMGKNSGL